MGFAFCVNTILITPDAQLTIQNTNNMKTRILKNIGSIAFFVLYVIPALAEDDYPQYPDSSDDVPIDHWVIALILAGIVLGIHYIGLRKKAQTDGS